MMTSRSVKRGSKHSIVSRGVLLGFYECGIDDFAGKSNRHGHIVLWTQRRAGLVADKRKGKTAFWENKRQKHWMSSFEAQRNNLYIPKPKWSKRALYHLAEKGWQYGMSPCILDRHMIHLCNCAESILLLLRWVPWPTKASCLHSNETRNQPNRRSSYHNSLRIITVWIRTRTPCAPPWGSIWTLAISGYQACLHTSMANKLWTKCPARDAQKNFFSSRNGLVISKDNEKYFWLRRPRYRSRQSGGKHPLFLGEPGCVRKQSPHNRSRWVTTQ